MGNVRKAEGKVLVAEHVQRCTTFCVHMRKLPSTFEHTSPSRDAADIPTHHTLQMDGGFALDANGIGIDEVLGTGKRRPDKSGGRTGLGK